MNADDAARLMGVTVEVADQILREWRSRPLVKVARCRAGHTVFRLFAVDGRLLLLDGGDALVLLPRATLGETPFNWAGYAARCTTRCRPTTWLSPGELATEVAKNLPRAPLVLR